MSLCGVMAVNEGSSQATNDALEVDDNKRRGINDMRRINTLISTVANHYTNLQGFKGGISKEFHRIKKIGDESKATVDYV